MSYSIEFAESVKGQLQALTARQRSIILEAIESQLVHEPAVETRNRKLRRPNPLAPWQLRVGQLRVFYEVSADEPQVVHILAVGQKKGNRLLIGGVEVQL
jgi:mRNA-degrading endonuclease RelE of RelBE toxin-antitoxin system